MFRLKRTNRALERIAAALDRARRPALQLTGANIMFIVKDDAADVAYSITAPTVTDSEGHPVDPQPVLTFTVASDNDAAVSITPTDPANPVAGTVHFGAPGLANINVTASSGDTLVGSFGAQFTVTTGDPAAITGGTIAFDGLIES